MMKIEKHQVDTFSLEYKSIYGDKHSMVSITDWRNGDGVDVTIDSNDMKLIFSLTHEDMNALLTVYNATKVVGVDDDEA